MAGNPRRLALLLSSLLESPDGERKIRAIWKEVTTKRVRSEERTCRRCKDQAPVELEVYKLADVIKFLEFAATYGVGKPVEQKTVTVDVTHRAFTELPDAELLAIAEGRAVIEGEAVAVDEVPALNA